MNTFNKIYVCLFLVKSVFILWDVLKWLEAISFEKFVKTSVEKSWCLLVIIMNAVSTLSLKCLNNWH